MHENRLVLQLALKDLLFERLLSICLIAATVAVIAPLLLLFSIKYGIVTSLENTFKANPHNLEIRMLSGYKLDEEFFKNLEQNEHVAFVIGNTRSLSATGAIRFSGKVKQSVEIIPTGINDPLLAYSGITNWVKSGEAVISSRLAMDLGIDVDATVELVITRKFNGADEAKRLSVKIVGVLDKSLSNNYAIYMVLSDLVAIEDYKDGYEPNYISNGSHLNTSRRHYAKARIYAKSIDSVEPLSLMLRANYNISDKLVEIANIRAIDRVLRFIFMVIAATSITGGVFALFGLIISNIKRKTKTFAMLRLGGFSPKHVIFMIVTENFVLALVSYILSLLLFLLGQYVLEEYFADVLQQQVFISLLELKHIVFGCLITLGVASLISIICGRLITKNVDFAKDLREA